MKLASLIEMVGRRIASLERVSSRAARLPLHDFEKERLASFVCVDLFNLNSEWMRHYYLGVSTNTAVRINGRKIVIGRKHQNPAEAISYAIDKFVSADAKLKWTMEKTRFFEPSWNSVNLLPQLAAMLGFPDRFEIGTSIGAGRDALNTLRSARNYYSHRNADNRSAFRAQLDRTFSWTKFQSPSEDIFNRKLGMFPNLFAFWLDDSERINREVCEVVR